MKEKIANAKCNRVLLGLILVFVSTAALAGERYEASIRSRTNAGKEKVFGFSLELDQGPPGIMSGKFTSFGAGACSGARKFEGGEKNDGTVQFRVEALEAAGCWPLSFKGRREADGTIAGKMRFQGEDHQLIFRK